MSERKILVKIVGCSDIISPVGYPWTNPNEAHRLSLDVIILDVFYDRNRWCMISHMGNVTGCSSGKNIGEVGCSDVIILVGCPRM